MPPKPAPAAALAEPTGWRARLCALAFGMFLSLALLKFGTPAVMDKFIDMPANGWEWLVFGWPLRLAYPLLGGLVLLGLFAAQMRWFAPKWLLTLLTAWLVWQFVATTQSMDVSISRTVLPHFCGCVICFFLGALCLQGKNVTAWFFAPILAAFAMIVLNGFSQHFGGLQQTRDYFWTYIYPAAPNIPAEYIAKMRSNRIFSTVFYPNAFAGALLLLLPPMVVWIWQAKRRFTSGARMFLASALGFSAAACLYWTGSKGGWLLALGLGAIALLHQTFPRRLKVLLVLALVVTGGLGFLWKTRDYMKRGASSVVARFDYWRAAGQTAWAHPAFGSGPGTFAIAYQAVKRPESEMARLTHNDYLQQASDSGFPGLLTYGTFIGGLLWISYRRLNWPTMPLPGAVWLGLLGWAAQSAFEFTLYVPSLAWTAFALGGWLLGNTRETIRQSAPPAPNLPKR